MVTVLTLASEASNEVSALMGTPAVIALALINIWQRYHQTSTHKLLFASYWNEDA